jgi:hypothetical protein
MPVFGPVMVAVIMVRGRWVIVRMRRQLNTRVGVVMVIVMLMSSGNLVHFVKLSHRQIGQAGGNGGERRSHRAKQIGDGD